MSRQFDTVFPYTVLWLIVALFIAPFIHCIETSYPSRFIVKLSPELTPSLSDFEVHLRALNISYRLIIDYTTLVPDVFFGVSLYLDHAEDVALLQNSTRVERLSTVRDVLPLKALDLQIVDQPIVTTPDTYPPHVQTNITLLHRLGILGQGVKIAILDSGIDCAHPALGGGFGPGRRIAFGLDLVGDKFNGTNDPVKGGSPCTKCGLHGTHVAGIVAAQNVGFGFTGVAPKASLGMYRIFGCGQESQTRDDILLEGVLTAVKDGADIITMSLGGAAGWGQGAILYDVINALVIKKSAIIIASAGNEGATGLFFASNPASSENAISVGSVDATSVIARYFHTSTGKKVLYRSAIPFPTGNFPLYFTSNSSLVKDDACSPLPDSTPDLSHHIVVIRRGECYFMTKVEHAQAKGARTILFYWNSTTPLSLPNRMSNSSVAVVGAEDGELLLKEWRQNNRLGLIFTDSPATYVASPTGGFMSNFSQFGPSYDFLSPQPGISAVGGDVVSTYPLEEGGYASSSGTSMAAPQIAGIAALVLEARGKQFNGLSIRSRLSSTARLIRTDLGRGLIESVVHQGGGVVDAFCAVFSNTTVSSSCIALGDSSNFLSDHNFTVFNQGTLPVSYRVGHVPAGSLPAFSCQSKYHRLDAGAPTPSANYASLQVEPENFTLMPGKSQLVKIKFAPPSGLRPYDLNVYSGYVSLTSETQCESHTIAYYGVLGSLKDQQIIDRGPYEDADPHRRLSYHFPHFVFENNNRSSSSAVEKPLVWNLKQHSHTTLRFRANFGSPYMRLDLLHRNPVFSNVTNSSNAEWKSTFRGVRLLGLIPLSDIELFSRSDVNDAEELDWNATVLETEYSKPQLISGGTYQVLLRALKVTGDKQNEADWDTWLSPLIYLKP